MRSMVLLLIFALLVTVCHHCNAASQVSSLEFNQAIEAAMQDVVTDASLNTFVQQLTFFPVPTCNSRVKYPPSSPIPSSLTRLNLCYDGASYIPPDWIRLYRMVGQLLVKTLNSKYGLSLQENYVLVDTATEGYFAALSRVVLQGDCDVSVADTTVTTERAKTVVFPSCTYGSTSNGFLGTTLDNATLPQFQNVLQLNRSDVVVAFYGGTVYEEWARQYLSGAVLKAVGYDEQFQLAKNNQVHAVIGDATDMYGFLSGNPKNASFVKPFGDPSPYGVFVARTNVTRSSFAPKALEYKMGWMVAVVTFWAVLFL